MAEEQGQRDSEGLCSTKLKVSPGQGCLVRSQEPEEELMLTLTLPHTCRDTERRRSDRRTQRRPRGAVTHASHARAVQAVCAVSSGHREFGPDSGSSQGGQKEDGWQPVSSLATATHQPRGQGPAPLRKQPALPYSGRVRRGRHFL